MARGQHNLGVSRHARKLDFLKCAWSTKGAGEGHIIFGALVVGCGWKTVAKVSVSDCGSVVSNYQIGLLSSDTRTERENQFSAVCVLLC